MKPSKSRREFLRLIGLGSAAALVAACSQTPSPAAPPTSAPAAAPATKAAPAAEKAAPAAEKAVPLVEQLYEAAKKEGKVVWWDQHLLEVAQQFMDSFKKRYPGIEVEYFIQTQDELKTRAVAEARAGRISFDVIDSGQNYSAYKEVGIFVDNTDVLLAAGVAADQQYEGSFSPEWTVNGAAYNPDLMKAEELPRTWEGFLEPQWKGKFALESRLRPFVYATPFWGGEEKVGEFLRKIKDQNPRFTRGDTESNTLLVAGEFPVLVGSYLQNVTKFKQKGRPWEYVPLDEVFTVAPGPGYTVPEKAPHRNAGRLFLYWLAGPDGTKLTDELRFKGNPMAGTGTEPSKYLEERKMTVRMAPLEYELNYKKYEQKYLEALGLPVS